MACLALLALWGCNTPDAPDFIKSTGPDQTTERPLPGPIRELIIEDDIAVLLTPDTAGPLSLTAGANLLPKIATDYHQGRLTLSNNNRFTWVRTYHRQPAIRIPAGQLRLLEHRGYAYLRCSDTLRLNYLALRWYGAADGQLSLRTNAVEIDANGIGSLTLAGQSQYTYLFTLKTAQVNARSLNTHIADVAVGSLRTASLAVQDTLRVNMLGQADLWIYGRPHSTQKGAGSGKLIFR